MKGDDMLAGLETPQEELTEDRPPKEYLTHDEVRMHAFAFLAIAAGALIGVCSLFALAERPCPDTAASTATAPSPTTKSEPGTTAGTVAERNAETATGADGLAPACMGEGKLFILVIMCGTIGGLIHAITSFVDFAGNRQLLRSWVPWLYLRAPIASLLAVLVYLAYRAQVFGTGEVSGMADLYQIALAAGLAGLFSKQVTDKMSDLIDSIFVPLRKPERKDALVPEQGQAGTQAFAQPAEQFDETIQRAQQLLIELGYLPKLTDGAPSDDGLLDDTTRRAVDVFLRARGLSDEERRASLGEEVESEYWPRLLEFLEPAKR